MTYSSKKVPPVFASNPLHSPSLLSLPTLNCQTKPSHTINVDELIQISRFPPSGAPPMNRSFKDYAVPGAPSRSLLHHHRRGNSLNPLSRDSDDHRSLDLFSNSRRSVSLASDDDFSDDRTASLKLGKISVGTAKPTKSGLDDLLAIADGGKHDYDWLLTPPETPLFPSAEGNEFQQSFTAPRSSSAARSASTTKPSRLSSTTHVESNVSSRPARSNSVTRSAISSSQTNSYSSMRSSSILNTSSASVSSYIRPSSPSTRSSLTSRPSTPSARTTSSRSSTPSKARSAPTLSSTDKPRPTHGSRPSTPTSRTQIGANSTSPSTLFSSRPSTPTQRSTISSSSPGPNLLASTVRGLSNGRSQTSVSRPSSPGPRIRPQQPIPPDFPHDTPPNLRTSLLDRPISVGRSRTAPAMTAKSNSESLGHGSFPRRASSPAVSRGRSVEPKGRSHVHSNGHAGEAQEPRKTSYVPESPSRRNLRASTTTADSNGFGRSISKKSLDMAIKHMDIRNGSGNMRPLAGTVLYPSSVRSASSKIQASQTLNNSASSDLSGRFSAVDNGFIPEYSKYTNGAHENGKREENGRLYGRLNEVDIFESSRYDAILLKEDLKNTNWLLSGDEKTDQGLLFDHGFESLPEPFGLS